MDRCSRLTFLPNPHIITGPFDTALGQMALVNLTTGFGNTAVGVRSLFSNMTGNSNTAIGRMALESNLFGGGNTAMGVNSLGSNLMGMANTAVGSSALRQNTADWNTGVGAQALLNNDTGFGNTAVGHVALHNNVSGIFNTATGRDALNGSTGSQNTASGAQALQNLTMGDGNIALGFSAGLNLTSGSDNIYVGHLGAAMESDTIRIGSGHLDTYVAGISGSVVAGGIPVLVDGNGRLGTMPSSRRFKDDIRDMGEASDGLMQLRPVMFRYKSDYAKGDRVPQPGLVAEEVAEVYPDLVTYSVEGEIVSVQYQKLTTMLLNELQKQNRKLSEQDKLITDLASRLEALESKLSGGGDR